MTTSSITSSSTGTNVPSLPGADVAVVPDAAWPAPQPVAGDRVLVGAPETNTLVQHEDGASQLGLWRCTPGTFTTDHRGYTEHFTVLEGSGSLVHEDGTRLALLPHVSVVLADGWRGRWVVDETLVKAFAIVPVRD